MQRVMIVGGPGSGKSTLARRLGEATGLPVVHIDTIHYGPGWVERSRDEKAALTREVHARDAWIFDGNFSATYAERVARADTLVWLDVPLGRRLWRVLRRTFRYRGQTRPEMPEGCTERFGRETLAFVHFILVSNRRSRAQFERLYREAPAHMRAVRLRASDEIDAFVTDMSSGRASGARGPG